MGAFPLPALMPATCVDAGLCGERTPARIRSRRSSPACSRVNRVDSAGRADLCRAVPVGRLVVVRGAGALQELSPGRHSWATSQDRPPFALGHPSPNAPLDPVVECLGQAFQPHRASATDGLGVMLRRTLYEQTIGLVQPAAGCESNPVTTPCHPGVPSPDTATRWPFNSQALPKRLGRTLELDSLEQQSLRPTNLVRRPSMATEIDAPERGYHPLSTIGNAPTPRRRCGYELGRVL